ncbi:MULTISPECIES: hypothetical protein [unclassified Streptomyces]|uniref:hypothetical protein n=1 Tax=unclassified Streptomyces TaxID=2593676 RepID=UPI000DC32667|nr:MULTISPECIES: hypothetical protein [unclassified Streptomyces]MYT69170.1 hypothetical protein [Streptomyces sp. SID8367]RAJ82685.1 hypothetical protein K377_04406 [Streptomyces sp. PsTaAH-137]
MAAPPSSSLRVASPPVSRGGIGLAQGRYGVRGNLELVLCDDQDGLWVLWFNSDPRGTAPEPGGPPPGDWSGGLRFAAGRRYDEVGVLQSRHGPHHLELVARSGDSSHRLRWSPEAAFTTEPPPPSGPARAVVAAETADGTLWTGVLGTDGEPRVLRADPSAYPHLAWSDDSPAHALLTDSRWTAIALVAVRDGARPGIVLAGDREGLYLSPTGDTHPIPAGTVAAAVAGDVDPRIYVWSEGPWLEVVTPGRPGRARRLQLPGIGDVTAVAATPVSFEPGRTDLVVRRGGQLWHLRDTGPGGDTVAATPLMSRLTSVPGDGPRPVHRG